MVKWARESCGDDNRFLWSGEQIDKPKKLDDKEGFKEGNSTSRVFSEYLYATKRSGGGRIC
jgi:hypothetical protein